MSKSNSSQKWYYDACALDNDKNTYKEVFNNNKRRSIESLAGNLSIGEAYGNSYRKKGKEAADSFINLIKALNKIGAFKIVDHCDIKNLFSEIIARFPRLEMTDAIHLSTAIRNGCCNLRTVDSDLYNLPSKEVRELAIKFNAPNFAITKIN